MKQITLQVDDSKYERLMAFLELLDFVQIHSTENLSIPRWQQEEVARRLQKVEEGTENIKSWEAGKKDLLK